MSCQFFPLLLCSSSLFISVCKGNLCSIWKKNEKDRNSGCQIGCNVDCSPTTTASFAKLIVSPDHYLHYEPLIQTSPSERTCTLSLEGWMSSACQNMYFWRGLFILEELIASHLKHYVESTLLQHGGRNTEIWWGAADSQKEAILSALQRCLWCLKAYKPSVPPFL